jgi:hypothetical protein
MRESTTVELHSRVSIHRWILPWLLAVLAGMSSDASRPAPPLPKVAVVPFVIIPQALDGAPTRADQDVLVRRLAEEASERAARSLLRQHFAAAVERPSSPSSATAPVLLAGTVRLPLSLPPRLCGYGSWFHRGRFATAEVKVQRADGTLVAREEVILDWCDIRWYWGAGRLRHSRPLDDVLVDFVRKATDGAVKRLKQHDLVSAVHEMLQLTTPQRDVYSTWMAQVSERS